MNVNLIHFTGKGTSDEKYYAARLLAFTKSTRLQMTPDGMEKFNSLSEEDVISELSYMSATIASSWEFADVVFAVNDISRACAQQMTRTRTASFAMQSQRVTDMSQVSFHIPDGIGEAKRDFIDACQRSLESYRHLTSRGVSLENARGVLPINSNCNLIAKYNLRAWVDVVRARKSLRVQGEYVSVVQAMEEEVLKVWPWALSFIEPKSSKAIAIIEEVAKSLPQDQKLQLAKAADLLKKETA